MFSVDVYSRNSLCLMIIDTEGNPDILSFFTLQWVWLLNYVWFCYLQIFQKCHNGAEFFVLPRKCHQHHRRDVQSWGKIIHLSYFSSFQGPLRNGLPVVFELSVSVQCRVHWSPSGGTSLIHEIWESYERKTGSHWKSLEISKGITRNHKGIVG